MREENEKIDVTAKFTASGYVYVYSRGIEVGLGRPGVLTNGAPSFMEFYLNPWAYSTVYTRGAVCYPLLFPWVVVSSHLDPWSPYLRPLLCSDDIIDDPMSVVHFVRQMKVDFSLFEKGGKLIVRT